LADPPRQLEAEPNSGVNNATPLTFLVSGDSRTATVAGAILPAGELDYFNLGTVNAGETIFLTSRKPGTSPLDPVVAVYNATNGYMVESGSGRPFDGVAQVNITQTGTYFAVMRGGSSTGGLTAQYLMDVNIVPTGSVDFPNLQVTGDHLAVGGPFLSGQPVTFDYTVTNVGSQPTNTGNWSDKVVLSLNTIFGDADDLTLGVFPHTGVLEPGEFYTAIQTVNLPDGIQGDFYLLVETDTTNAVATSSCSKATTSPHRTAPSGSIWPTIRICGSRI
jgi:hypothetical protein